MKTLKKIFYTLIIIILINTVVFAVDNNAKALASAIQLNMTKQQVKTTVEQYYPDMHYSDENDESILYKGVYKFKMPEGDFIRIGCWWLFSFEKGKLVQLTMLFYPHGANSQQFLDVLWMLKDKMESTYGKALISQVWAPKGKEEYTKPDNYIAGINKGILEFRYYWKHEDCYSFIALYPYPDDNSVMVLRADFVSIETFNKLYGPIENNNKDNS